MVMHSREVQMQNKRKCLKATITPPKCRPRLHYSHLGKLIVSATYKGRGQGPTLNREINTIDQSSASPTASLVGLE